MNVNKLSACVIALTSLIILMPHIGMAQSDKMKTLMAALQAETATIGAPRTQGDPCCTELYFGNTRAHSRQMSGVLEDFETEHRNETWHPTVELLVKHRFTEPERNVYEVVASNDSRSVGTFLQDSTAKAKLDNGEGYYTIKSGREGSIKIELGYEPIKDASGGVIGAYFFSRR